MINGSDRHQLVGSSFSRRPSLIVTNWLAFLKRWNQSSIRSARGAFPPGTQWFLTILLQGIHPRCRILQLDEGWGGSFPQKPSLWSSLSPPRTWTSSWGRRSTVMHWNFPWSMTSYKLASMISTSNSQNPQLLLACLKKLERRTSTSRAQWSPG